MKVIYDAIGAAPGSGGPELHAREFLRAWLERYPDDEILAVGTPMPDLTDELGSQVRWLSWPSHSLILRVIGQMVFIPALMQVLRTHKLIVTVPVLSPLTPGRRSFVFVHDWRHLTRPDEFSALRRAYRRIYPASVRRAVTAFCISPKTLAETTHVVPGAALILAENGYDHTRRWEPVKYSDSPTLSSLRDGRHVIVTFGHRNNKRPELVIAALAHSHTSPTPQLVVLGASGSYRETLRDLARSKGLDDDVHLPGFVDDTEYRVLIKFADCVVLGSTDEGFGVPVAEALSFGHPVVGTSDSGLNTIFHGLVIEAHPEPAAVGTAIDEALSNGATTANPSHLRSWADTASIVRSALSNSRASRTP